MFLRLGNGFCFEENTFHALHSHASALLEVVRMSLDPGFQDSRSMRIASWAQVRLHLSRRLLRKVAFPDMLCQDVLIQES